MIEILLMSFHIFVEYVIDLGHLKENRFNVHAKKKQLAHAKKRFALFVFPDRIVTIKNIIDLIMSVVNNWLWKFH